MIKLTNIYKQIKENQSSKYTIYQDLDGCLGAFDEQFQKYSGGISCDDYVIKFGRNEFWEVINKAGSKFWSEIKWLPDGKQLWNYIKPYNPIILTAPSYDPSSKIGKKEWMENNLPGVEMILCYAKDKKQYASSTSILIDDSESNIKDWSEAGGISILYTSTTQTIKELKKLGL